MLFDVQAARQAGYTDAEIADYLAQQTKFDIKAARQAGYNDNEIVGYLTERLTKRREDNRAQVFDVSRVPGTEQRGQQNAARTPTPQEATATAANADLFKQVNASSRGLGQDLVERRTPEQARAITEIGKPLPIAADGYLERQGVKFKQAILGIGSGLARAAVADATDPYSITGSWLPQSATDYLTNRADQVDAYVNAPVQGDTTFEDVKAAPGVLGKIGTGLGFVAEQGPSSLAYLPLYASPLGIGVYGVSLTGNIGQQRAVADGRSQADATDIAVAAPFAAASTALDKFGFENLIGEQAGNVVMRVGKAALAEGATEFVQNPIEYAGGSLGTKEGFDPSQALDQAIAGGLVGAGAGGAFRGAAEAFDAAGRIRQRRADDARVPPAGDRAEAVRAATQVTPEDVASPLPTQDIVEGRAAIAAATGAKTADTGLAAAGAPPTGTRVKVDNLPGGKSLTGTIADHFSDASGAGVVIQPEDGGKPMREYFDTLAELGVTITPEEITAAADAIDAALPAPDTAQDGGFPSPSSNPVRQASPSRQPQRLAATGGGVDSRIVAGLRARGFSEGQALGIAAGIHAESASNPSAKNPSSGAMGIGQWLGPRQAAIRARYGDNPTLEQQLDFLTEELRGKDAGGKHVLAENDPEAVLRAYITKFMRPKAGAETDGDIARGLAALGQAPQERGPLPGSEPTQYADLPDTPSPRVETPEMPAVPKRDIEGQQIDREWTAFSPESGTIGIPRAEMPQTKAEHRGAMVNFLNARGIAHQEETVPAASLKPSQAEFSPAKVEKAKGFEGGNRAILISADNYVVDGHHQWLAARDNGEDVRTIRLKAPIGEVLQAAREFPSSETAGGASALQATAEPAPKAAPRPSARIEPSSSGKGIVVIGASEAELAAIAKAVPQAKPTPPRKSDGGISYSAKYADQIRAAIAGVTEGGAAAAPASTGISGLPEGYSIQKTTSGIYLARPDGSMVGGYIMPSSYSISDMGRDVQKLVRKRAADDAAKRANSQQNTAGPQDGGGAAPVEAPKAGGPAATADNSAGSAAGAVTPPRQPDRSAAIIIDPAKGTTKTVPLGKKAPRDDSNPYVKKGDRFRVEREIFGEYLTAGQTYTIQSAGPDGVYFKNVERDSGTPMRNFNLRKALEDGSIVKVGEAAPTSQPVSDAQQLPEPVSNPDTLPAPEQVAPTPSKNRLVTDERAAELRARLKAKLNPNRLNSGIDPEILAIGAELAVYHIEKGARRFTAFARAIASDLDVPLASIRQYLRGWYNGARDMMEDMGERVSGMDDAEEVGRAMRTFDQWSAEAAPVTEGANDATGAVDAQLPNRVPASNAGSGTGDVQSTSPNRSDGSAPGQEAGRGGSAVPPADQGRADAPERGAGQSASGTRSDRTGVRNADNLPASERDAGSAGKSAAAVKGTDWTIEPGSLNEERSLAQKARDNIDAIALVKQIEREGRSATREEQAKIARYVGWGGLKNVFPDPVTGQYGKGFETLGPRLRELLTDEEYETAKRSIQYAHYTSESVVRPMWEIARQLGFTGGNVFEPGMGTGNFRGMMPADIAAASRYSGIEYDHLTASIAKLLYPQSGVQQADFITMPGMKDAVDLVIGNPPFSETIVGGDPEYAKHKMVLHDFFFAKSLDALKPGGLLMFITSAGTMNKLNEKARAYLAERADLVGAIRMPGNAFEQNAGTSVTTDIVILRKRKAGEAPGDRSWIGTDRVMLPDRDGNMIEAAVNAYFTKNPEMVLGEQGMFDKLVAGPRYAVRAPAGFDLAAAIRTAAERLPGSIVNTSPADMPEGFLGQDLDFGSGERKNGSYYIGPDGRLMQFRNGVGAPVQGRGKGVEGGMAAAAQERVRGLVPVKDALREVYAADIKNDAERGARAREKLNSAYDAFVAKFGPINKTEISYRRPSRVEMESMRAAAREEARLAGTEWDDGSFDVQSMLDAGAKMAEIAAARDEARAAAKAAGRIWNEGSFDPEEVPDKVIEKRPNLDPFMEDDEAYRLAAIEHYNKDTGEATKGRAFFGNAITLESKPTINSANDALLFSLNKFGRPDLPTIARMAGKSESAVLEELSDRLFAVPGQPGVYETGETYLSGNVREKLAIARKQAETDPEFTRNVRALEAAQPAPLTPTEIAANLGMPWVPTQVVEQFATEHMGLQQATVRYFGKLAQWETTGDTYSSAARSTWGTDRMDALAILSAALNRQTILIKDTINTAEGKKEVINEVATQAAQDKLAEIKQAFRDWVWTDEQRATALVDLYNREYNSLVAPKYDGSYLTTPGIASGWSWRPHQRAVIARIIQSGNTYMAHEVGAGKTSAMIGSGMEMKRLGLVNKPMYVVPNHMLGQFTKEFYEQYPLARILVADEQRFHTSRRKEFIARMASEDWDAVIITHSAFGFIPMSDEFQARMLKDHIDDLKDMITQIGKGQDQRITRRKAEQQKEAMEQRLRALTGRKRDQVYTFEETGVDFLFVDEAHLFRKLDFTTKMGNVKGIDPSGSQMSFDLFSKTRFLEQRKPGRNLVLASGTPITNTMAELYSVSRYLQQGELEKRGLEHFDAWAGAFGDTSTALEQDAAGGYKPVTRFSKFVNVPELSVMVRQVMDVVGAAELRQYVSLPNLKGGSRQLIGVDKTENQAMYMQRLQDRMEAIKRRSGPPQKGDDILLSVITDGRKAAIDYRLIDASAPKEPGSKLERMIEEVARRHKEFARTPFHQPLPGGAGFSEKPVTYGPATQMIFSDFGINGDFPVHKYIRNALIARGVPANQIALIQDYKTAVAKQRLFNDMNEGKVRVLIGSVAKMGTGVNAQKRLRALHNMDAQWYPANDTQRNGRIIRQGNMNPEIEILDYATNGTYDSTMWGMMARKAGFIEGFMRGDPNMRDMEDLGEASQYEQAAAMTTSDPRIMDLTEWKQDLEKIERRQMAHEREQHSIKRRIAMAQNDVENADRTIPLIEQDIAKRKLPEVDAFTGTVEGKTYDDAAEFGGALMAAMEGVVERANGKQRREGVGEFGGFPLVAESYPGPDGGYQSFLIKRSGDRETRVDMGADARGLVTRITNALKKFETELGSTQRHRAAAEAEIADFQPKLGATFNDGGQIADLRGKIKQLEDTLAAETAAIEKAKKEAAANAQPSSEPKQSIPEGRETLGEIDPEPVASLTGRELGKAPDGPGRMKFLRGSVEQWLRKNMTAGKTLRTSDGRNVKINGRGLREVVRGGEDLLRAVPALPAILERGTLIERRDGDGKGTRNMWVYAANVMIDGRKIALGAMVRETANGDFQYSINRMAEGGPATTAEAAGGNEKSSIQAELEAGDGSDLNLFMVPEAGKPATVANLETVADALREQLADLRLAEKVKVRVVETLGGAAGSYAGGVITIATDTAQGEPFTLNHEAIHALRDMGVFQNAEWAILSAAARRDPGLMRSIRQRYAKLTEEAQTEEAVADLFARFQDGRYEATGTVQRVFKMLRQFMEAVRNAFTGRGLRTAEGVMRDVARGEVGTRNSQGMLDGSARESRPDARKGAEIERLAQTLSEARAAAGEFVGKAITNASTGLVATVSKNNLLKMTSGKAVEKSTSTADHALAVANADHLFEGAQLSESYPDRKGEPTIAAIHRYIARMTTADGRVVAVKLTVKETTGPRQPNPLYTLETLEVEPPSVSETSAPEQDRNVAPGGSEGDIVKDEPDAKFSIPERADMVAAANDGPTWREKAGDAFDKWRVTVQDRYLPLLKVQREIEKQTGKSLPISLNPYMGEELMSGRIGARLESLADDHVQPLFDAMHADKVSVEALESYLYARHAPERNARMQEINPELGPGEGSGMTDLEAAAIMSRIRRDGKMDVMERLAARVDAIINLTLDYRVETGLMSQKQADEWRSTYEFYVPLRGFKETGGESLPARPNRSGGGINVRGPESRAAYGRRSEADSPLAYIIMQAEEAIVRGETNRVAQRFINLARANPDPEFWKVNKTTAKRRMNEDSGLVESYLTHNLLAEDKDWTVSAKFDGKEVRVTMNKDNPAARRLADAMRNLTQNQIDSLFVRVLGRVNRFLSLVNTSLNPEFVITNAFRDLQAALVNLSGENVKGITKGVLRDYRAALVASTKGAFGTTDGEWGKWYDEFVNNGGRVYFNKVENIDEIKQRIAKAAERATMRAGDGGGLLQAKRMLLGARDLIENVNLGVENAVRLAAYKNAREAGLSPDQAASLAKNLTVNFNRRGTAGPLINAFYLFANASIQGTARFMMAPARSSRVRKLLAATMIGAAALEILNAMVSALDDDGESIYDKIPAYEKSRNLIIMMPDGKSYVKIPLAYGYNVFFGAGRSAAEIARRGGDRWLETMGHFAGDVADAFNPIGGNLDGRTPLQALVSVMSPTILDPFVDLSQNRNAFGRKIMPDQPAYDAPDPEHKRYWGSGSPIWRPITDALSNMTGGDGVVPGVIDVSPEMLEYMSGIVMGAAGGFIQRVGATGLKALYEPDQITANDIPFLREVVGDKPTWYDKSVFYDRLADVAQQEKYAKGYRDAQDFEGLANFAAQKRAYVMLEPAAKAARRDIKEVREARTGVEQAKDKGLLDSETYRERKLMVDLAEQRVVQRFNTAWNTAMKLDRSEPEQ